MRTSDAKIIRRRLDDYSDWKRLKLDADEKVLEIQCCIDALGCAPSPCLDKVAPIQNRQETSSKINELISDQLQYEREAKEYAYRMQSIEKYIGDNFEEHIQFVMRKHFLEEYTYEQLEEMLHMSSGGIKSMLYRAMEQSDYEKAKHLI